MKLHPDRYDVQSITAYGPGWIAVNGERLTHSVILSSRGLREVWPVRRFEDLAPTHFEALAALEGELLLFGSGARMRFAPPAWLQALMRKRMGVETMDTAAACRTYNILAGEGRHVLAALLVEDLTEPR